MNYDQLFPARFIKAGEFQGKPVTLTVASVDREGLERDDGTEETAAILTFNEKRKNGAAIQMVLNKTNAQAIFAMWPDTEEWVGKRITLYPEPDDSGMSDSGYRIRVQGSPDIDKAITYTLKLPRRKPKQCKLTKTTAARPKPEPVEEPEYLDDKYGETMPDFDDLEG